MFEGKRKKKRRSGLLTAVLLLAAALILVVIAVRGEREGGLRALWRSLRGETGADEFFFENASGGDVAVIDLGLAVAANSGLYVYDLEGELVYNRLYTWQTPAIRASGDYGAAWDVGGNLVLFFGPDKMITEVTPENPVVSARVNSLGYFTVCTEAEGYKGIVTVYNSLGTAIYRWSAGHDRILSACVSGRDELLVLALGEGGSRLVLMPLDSEEQTAEYTYPGLIIDAAFTDAGITAVSTEGLIGLSGTLEERWGVDLEGRYLEDYDIGSSGCLMAVSDFQVGGVRTLKLVSAEGQQTGSVELYDQITDIDMMDDRMAVLSGGRIAVYGANLGERDKYDCDFGAERVILRSDGTVLAAGTFSAYVYGGKSKSD